MSDSKHETGAEAKVDRGWGDVRPRDRVAHYYVNGFSLCRKVGFYNGPLLDTGDRIWPNDCKACARKFARQNRFGSYAEMLKHAVDVQSSAGETK